MNMKKIISTLSIFTILFSSIFFVSAEGCKYKSQIKECKEANKNGSPRAIKEFLCVDEIEDEKMIYNLILDDKFKEVDKAADEYLETLENDKTKYFGPEQKETFLTGIDDITRAFGEEGEFYNHYVNQLKEVRAETVECLGNSTSIVELKNKFETSSQVNNLIKAKNSRRKKVAVDILILNKQQVRDDENKKFMQVRRTMYDSVSSLLMINLGYLMRIMFKWASKTKNPY